MSLKTELHKLVDFSQNNNKLASYYFTSKLTFTHEKHVRLNMLA